MSISIHGNNGLDMTITIHGKDGINMIINSHDILYDLYMIIDFSLNIIIRFYGNK